MDLFVHVSSSTFSALGMDLMRKKSGIAADLSRFRAFCGVTPNVCGIVWNSLGSKLPASARPVFVLWALMFLKVYASEHIHCSVAGCDEKIFRKWSWHFVELIADMNVINVTFLSYLIRGVFHSDSCFRFFIFAKIRWNNRLKDALSRYVRVSVDGTDCHIVEPFPFSTCWYSHKFKGPEVRYEVAICIASGHIVWVHGPFPCETYPDLWIFRSKLRQMLDSGERVLTDGGYPDDRCITPKDADDSERDILSRIRARQEVGNRRLKHFSVLSGRFRHQVQLHASCFHAVANLTQLMIDNESPLFDVE